MTTPQEPTLGELARVLARFEADMRRALDELTARLDRMVTVDLYEAHRAATAEKITDLEDDLAKLREALDRERSERHADRRVLVGSAFSAALSLVVAVLSAVLLAMAGLN